MKTALIVLAIIIIYAAIGYAFSICCKAWGGEWFKDCPEVGAVWVAVVPFLLLYAVVRFIGKRIAVIPVMIIALIKARESEDNE